MTRLDSPSTTPTTTTATRNDPAHQAFLMLRTVFIVAGVTLLLVLR